MLARVKSFLLQGTEALPCEVEIDHDLKDHCTSMIVGLPDAAVKESLERVRSALMNSGYPYPRGRVLINLAPADVRKEGPVYDLPIAVGLLLVQGVIPARPVRPGPAASGSSNGAAFEAPDARSLYFAGEVALDGSLRPVRGAIALGALARDREARGVMIPGDNAGEAAVVGGIDVFGVRSLVEVVGLLSGQIEPEPCVPVDVGSMLHSAEAPVDFAEVKGQEGVKRAVVIAAAGMHNLVMLGPPGTGKTMMARALPGIMPPLTAEEAIDITRVYSAAGQLPPETGLITVRPVRTPHHTASSPAIIGGGAVPRPGEISLAHHGVLFLDELPEFPRPVLETLRQPLEDHIVTIARSHSAVRFPASFMLVAALNPTPKGDMPDSEFSQREMQRYLSRISGPLIDRLDIHVEAPAVPWKQLSKASSDRSTSSGTMRARVLAARTRQRSRQGDVPNSRLRGAQLDRVAVLPESAMSMLGQAMTELGLSARAYDKVRRVSRTIADLDGRDAISDADVTEAISYRLLDRRG